ncbi:hypothetical protein O181_044438 [Austropuccinia psidii MF-1]|uniref:Uncharacterized protein n=1 Tax=Austropuccinia psidii MF-1 TaxID=1389203 RepID=A0A9Q3DNB9_9BASI|nr:hypothetical protein [Austropuccinia psidii MF-1]
MIQIQEPKSPWEIVNMDLVIALPPGGDRSYNECLVLVDRYTKTPLFLSCHNDDTDMDTAIMIWNKFSTSYHSQTDGLAERMIQTLEDMIRRFCAYGLELKDSDSFTHDLCTLILALELAYKTSINSSTGKTPEEMLQKAASSFKIILDKERHHANRCMQDYFKYAKERWDESHKPPDYKVGELVLVSTLNFNNSKGPNKLKDAFEGPFMIKALHWPNSAQLKLTSELMNKHPTFLKCLIKPYSLSDKDLFPLRNKPPLEISS